MFIPIFTYVIANITNRTASIISLYHDAQAIILYYGYTIMHTRSMHDYNKNSKIIRSIVLIPVYTANMTYLVLAVINHNNR